MDVYKILSIYAGIFIFVNLMMYSHVASPFPATPPDLSLLGVITSALHIITSALTFPFTVLSMLWSENPLIAIIYSALTIPAYLGIIWVFIQSVFWLVGKMFG